jgi:hypothetical protein
VGQSVKDKGVGGSFIYPYKSCHLAKIPWTLRRYLLYSCGRFIFTAPRPCNAPLLYEARHESTQLQQIGEAAQCAPTSRDNLKLRNRRIGPLRRNGTNPAIVKAQQPPFARSVAVLADANPSLPGIRMKGVRHRHKLQRGR